MKHLGKTFAVLILTLASIGASAQISPNVATTEQKLKFAKLYITQVAADEGFSLVEDSLDLYASNNPLAIYKPLSDLGYFLTSFDSSGKIGDIEYVNFMLINSKGKKFRGYVNVVTLWAEAAGKHNAVNPILNRAVAIHVGGRYLTTKPNLNLTSVD
jgi:hypothetical protein